MCRSSKDMPCYFHNFPCGNTGQDDVYYTPGSVVLSSFSSRVCLDLYCMSSRLYIYGFARGINVKKARIVNKTNSYFYAIYTN